MMAMMKTRIALESSSPKGDSFLSCKMIGLKTGRVASCDP